ncbi:MAG: hypothetical protein KDB14_28335 [Planctomycetales bacterium]|nr:hypothetical protein [Planctomycetales bacterium]
MNDLPPPDKQAQDFLKDEIKSARNGIGAFMILGFSLARSIQVFSRVPGSSGLYFQLAWTIGVALQGFYLAGHVEIHGRVDAVPFEYLLILQGACWLVSFFILAVHWTLSTRPPHDKAMGRGLLTRHLPGLSEQKGGIVSDVAVGGLLIVLLLALRCPVQAACYRFMLGWTLCCHLAIYLRDAQYRWRIRTAHRRAARWRDDVRGRHYL